MLYPSDRDVTNEMNQVLNEVVNLKHSFSLKINTDKQKDTQT